MQWNREFNAHLVNLDKKKPVIVAGDMNVAHNEIGESVSLIQDLFFF